MDTRLSIIPRLRRFGRNLASSLDEEGERFSAISRRTSLSMRRLGRSIAATLDLGVNYVEDDPVGAFIESMESESHVDEDQAVEAPTVNEIPTASHDVESQRSGVAKQRTARKRAQRPVEAPPAPARDTEAPLDHEQREEDSTPEEPMDAAVMADAPASPPESEAPHLDVPQPPQAEIPPESPAEPLPTADLATEASLEEQPADAELSSEEPVDVTAMASFDTVSLEIDGQESKAESLPDNEPGETQPAQEEEMGMTATIDSENLSLDMDAESTDLEGAPLEGGSQHDSDADSLLDIFRSEDIEENPITELARELSDVDVHQLLGKARNLAEKIKGQA